jgi:cell pole-organizing protein PopZ
MSASNPQHEPTMEEILASIRKIISEDQPDQGKPAAAARSEAAPEPMSEPDVLDLTDEIRDDGSISPVAPPMTNNIPPSRQFENDVAFESIDEPPEAETASETFMEPDDLISESTRSAVGRVFESIEEEPAPMRMSSASSSAAAGGSVEAVFRRAIQDAFEPTLQQWVDAHSGEILERMKPLIRDWMDQNLPSLIEGAVQREISRAVKPRRR